MGKFNEEPYVYNLDNFIIFFTLFAAEENSGLLHSGKIFIDAKPSFSHIKSRAALLRIIKYQLWIFPNQIHLSFKVWLKKRFVVSQGEATSKKVIVKQLFEKNVTIRQAQLVVDWLVKQEADVNHYNQVFN